MEYRLFQIKKQPKLLGRRFEVRDEQQRLVYLITSPAFSRQILLSTPDGLIVFKCDRQFKLFGYEYRVSDNAGFVTTVSTKSKSLKMGLSYMDEDRSISVVSNWLGNELTLSDLTAESDPTMTSEIAKASRQSGLFVRSFDLAIRDDYSHELGIAAVAIWMIIKSIRRKKRKG